VVTGRLIPLNVVYAQQADPRIAQDAARVLQQRCFGCHNQPRAARTRFVGDRTTMVQDGRVVPGRSNQSLLFQRIAVGPRIMPPSGRLPDAEIATIKRWIDAGAPDWRDTGPQPPPDYTKMGYLTTLAGSSGKSAYRVNSVAFSPDGMTLASGEADGIKLWDAQTAKLKLHHRTPDGKWEALSVTFSSNGLLFAGSGVDGGGKPWVGVWDAQTGRIARVVQVKATVNALSFLPDSDTLALATQDAESKPLIVLSGETDKNLNGLKDAARAVSFSRNGSLLAGASKDGTVELWDPKSDKEPRVLSLQGADLKDGMHAVAFSPDGKLLASGSGDGMVRLWDIEKGEVKNTKFSFDRPAPVRTVAFSPDGTVVAGGSEDKVLLWDAKTGDVKRTIQAGVKVKAIAFSPNGRLLAIAGDSEDGRGVVVWGFK
jgi:WD40 repeat protein